MIEFKWPYRVAISDINYGGHMGNDRSLSLFHEARIAYLKSIECTEMDIGDGFGIIMKDAQIDFLAEVIHGDQLEIFVSLGEVKGLLVNLEYKVFRSTDQEWVLKGKTGLLAFDYQKRKVVRTPSSFFQKIKDKYGD